MLVTVADPDLSMLRVIFNRRRQESGLTFDELAERSGVARQTLLNVSKRSIPRRPVDVAAALAGLRREYG